MQLIQRCSAMIQHFMCYLNRGVAPRLVHVKFVMGEVCPYSRSSLVCFQLLLHSVVHSFNCRLGNKQWTQWRSHFQDMWQWSTERYKNSDHLLMTLTFRHRASSILGQAFRCSPEKAFYIFNQQIYFIIWYLLDRASLI